MSNDYLNMIENVQTFKKSSTIIQWKWNYITIRLKNNLSLFINLLKQTHLCMNTNIPYRIKESRVS